MVPTLWTDSTYAGITDRWEITKDTLGLKFAQGYEACGIVSMPGDVLLQEIVDIRGESGIFGGGTVFGARLREGLTLHNFFTGMKFGHSEVVYQIDSGINLHSISYYPKETRDQDMDRAEHLGRIWRFYNNDDDYRRSNFTVLRPRGGFSDKRVMDLREGALEEAIETRDAVLYNDGILETARKSGMTEAEVEDDLMDMPFTAWPLSNCTTFVNDKCYDGFFTSYWNFIPYVRQAVGFLVPWEAVDTPDKIDDSPYAKRLCEVTEGTKLGEEVITHLKAPIEVDMEQLLGWAQQARESHIPEMKAHGDWLAGFFVREGIYFIDTFEDLSRHQLTRNNLVYRHLSLHTDPKPTPSESEQKVLDLELEQLELKYDVADDFSIREILSAELGRKVGTRELRQLDREYSLEEILRFAVEERMRRQERYWDLQGQLNEVLRAIEGWKEIDPDTLATKERRRRKRSLNDLYQERPLLRSKLRKAWKKYWGLTEKLNRLKELQDEIKEAKMRHWAEIGRYTSDELEEWLTERRRRHWEKHRTYSLQM